MEQPKKLGEKTVIMHRNTNMFHLFHYNMLWSSIQHKCVLKIISNCGAGSQEYWYLMVILGDMLHGWGQTSKQLERQGIWIILADATQ